MNDQEHTSSEQLMQALAGGDPLAPSFICTLSSVKR